MGKPTCSIDGCDRPAKSRGWCHTHYCRWKRTGDPGAHVPVVPHLPAHPAEGQCAIEGCENSVHGGSHGWCHAHYERWRRTGDVKAEVPIGPRTPTPPGGVCTIEGCEKPVRGLGWCGMHYMRWHEHGDALWEPPRQPDECTVEGCAGKPDSRGLCERHYTRLLRYGDPETPRPVLPLSEIGYRLFHTRLANARGKAASYKCLNCGCQARHWAWIHGEDPRSFDSYMPLCASCHMKYDLAPAVRKKNVQANRRTWGKSRYPDEAA